MSSNRVSKILFEQNPHEVLQAVQDTGVPILIVEQGIPILEVRPCKSSSNSALSLLQGTVLRFDAPTSHVQSEWLDETALQSLIAALLPKEMPAPRLFKEATMILRARNAVIASGDWLNAVEMATLIGLSVKNPAARLRRWRRNRLIFSICHDGITYFPGYALNPHNEYRPHRALKRVIELIAPDMQGWRLAFWLHSTNSFLGGRRPKELLATQSALVIAAARDEVNGAVHG